jgi:hypothetical protein
MTSYRGSTNTNNINKTTQDKTNKSNKINNKNKENGSAKEFYTQKLLTKNICTFTD